MIDTVIVGGGLCGLALAADLERNGQSYRLFEARERLGGRVLTIKPENHAAMDLGPAWFWPEIHPRVTRLVSELGLISFPQHDQGQVLRIKDADGKLENLGENPVHNGAMRLRGGMQALIEAFAKIVPAEKIEFNQVLVSIKDKGDYVLVGFDSDIGSEIVNARRVVVAIPPRLIAENLQLTPELDSELMRTLSETPTWMAGEAKAVIGFEKAFWRDQGLSGNGFAHHEQAVLGELYDACDPDAQHAAIGGFFALGVAQRESFKLGMPMLINSELVQLFGSEAEHGAQHYQDWATERFTCSTLDREPPSEHPEYANPLLSQTYWDGKLLFGSSESARYGGGYLEGALEAASRLFAQIVQIALSSANRERIEGFRNWALSRKSSAFEDYQRRLNTRLSKHQIDQLTQLSLLETVEKVYSDALLQLDSNPLDVQGSTVRDGRSEFTPWMLTVFNGFNDELLDQALKFNRTSCALSNFPFEHVLSEEYVQTIRQDLRAAWRNFALSVNSRLIRESTCAQVTYEAA